MRRLAFLPALGLLSVAPALAQTSPPGWFASPQVTVGANLKELVFDWEAVPGAVNYRLLVKRTDSNREYFAPFGDRTRRTRIAIPLAVHQERWQTTRYIVMACNTAGCTRSAEPDGQTCLASHAQAHDGDAPAAIGRAFQRHRAVARPREHEHHASVC